MSPDDEMRRPLLDLRTALSMQDAVVNTNWTSVRTELAYFDRGLTLAMEIDAYLDDDDVVAQRQAKPSLRIADAVIRNLLHGSWTALVSAVHLLLFGAHVDSMALIRSALEAAFHAEYFTLHPDEAEAWDNFGQIPDVPTFARKYGDWQSQKKVRRTVDAYSNPPGALNATLQELSTYGTHANPKTVGLRMMSDLPRIANSGFVSTGKTEFTQLCAGRASHVLAYVLGQYSDFFGAHLRTNGELMQQLNVFKGDYAAYSARTPRGLSPLR